MMETSQAIAVILIFATVIQFCVDRVKEIVGEKIMGYVKAPIWSLLFGILFTFVFSLDAFAMFGYTSQVPILAHILTGIILSAGAAPIHELIEAVRGFRLKE